MDKFSCDMQTDPTPERTPPWNSPPRRIVRESHPRSSNPSSEKRHHRIPVFFSPKTNISTVKSSLSTLPCFPTHRLCVCVCGKIRTLRLGVRWSKRLGSKGMRGVCMSPGEIDCGMAMGLLRQDSLNEWPPHFFWVGGGGEWSKEEKREEGFTPSVPGNGR